MPSRNNTHSYQAEQAVEIASAQTQSYVNYSPAGPIQSPGSFNHQSHQSLSMPLEYVPVAGNYNPSNLDNYAGSSAPLSPYATSKVQDSVDDPMIPVNYGVPVNAIKQDPISEADLNFSYTAEKSARDSMRDLQAGFPTPKPIMNQKVGPIVSDSRKPPPSPGFFGFWDRKGHLHQGYTDENLNIHYGVFDDQGYFHFGKFGSVEPIFVKESMMANAQAEEKRSQKSRADSYEVDVERPIIRNSHIQTSEQPRSDKLQVITGARETGGSMDVYANETRRASSDIRGSLDVGPNK